jgi:uncharacterized protein YndB with AHSA1/START domain
MAIIQETVEIRRPVDKVFTYTTNAKSWPHWHGTMPEAEQTSPGPVSVGTAFRGKNRMMGQTLPWTAKLTEYKPNKQWAKTIDSGSVIIYDQLILAPTAGGSRFTTIYDVKVGGVLRLLSPMIISSLRKQLKVDLIKVKRILESQT